MVKSHDAELESNIQKFLGDYTFMLRSLSAALNEAHISHYSSAQIRSTMAFELFPAASYVDEMLRMLSLQRDYKPKTSHGLKDANGKDDYNPAREFMRYLRRWTGFAENVMHHEGATVCGIAAAKAKLVMDELLQCFIECENGTRTPKFGQLMADIGRTLEARGQKAKEQHNKNNYNKALTLARQQLGQQAA